MTFQDKRFTVMLLGAVCLLLVPFVAMQITSEVNWNWFDFAIAGILLVGTSFAIELVLRRVRKTEHRIIVCLAILAALFLIWAELAVGIFGTPLAGS